MTLPRRTILRGGLAAGVSFVLDAANLTADQVHRELVDGNRRFTSGHVRHPHASLAWAKRTSRLGQHPHAVILCCSDSRVVPEIFFDQGIGDLFTVRVAGNVANGDEAGSIEYAVEHLGVPLCVVLGHTHCGAVKAVVSGEEVPEEIAHLVAPIRAAYDRAKSLDAALKDEALVGAVVRLNVEATVATLRHNTVLEARVASRSLRIEGGVYDLDTGHVGWTQK